MNEKEKKPTKINKQKTKKILKTDQPNITKKSKSKSYRHNTKTNSWKKQTNIKPKPAKYQEKMKQNATLTKKLIKTQN